MRGHPIEIEVGIEVFSTQIQGIGGKLRTKLEDFIVEEIDEQGQIINSLTLNDSNPKHNLNLNNLEKTPYTVILALEKYNLDTFTAVSYLANFLKIPLRNIGYAGLKDKRAVTVQKISISDINPKLLPDFPSKSIFLNRIQAGKPIKLGNLNGNHFNIVVRQIEESYELVTQRIKEIQSQINTSQIPNYYGPQRFGVLRPISHRIGEALLQKDYEAALKIYLTAAFPQEDEEIHALRVSLKESWPHINQDFPKDLFYERQIIHWLGELKTDYKKIINKVFPFRYYLLFIHAYQSYLFNRMLSARISNVKLPLNQAFEGENVALLDDYSLPTNAIYKVTSQNNTSLNKAISMGKAVVMLPLFSYDLEYSHHPLADFIDQLIEAEKIDISRFKSDVDKRLNFKTAHRPISFKPVDLKINIDEITDVSTETIVNLNFSINKGCYATILLRELMKTTPLNY